MAIRVALTPFRRCGRGEYAVCNKSRQSLTVIAPTNCSPSNPSKFDGPHMEVIGTADALRGRRSSPTFETATWYANIGSIKSRAPSTSDISATASLIICSARVRPAREHGPACCNLILRAKLQRSSSCPGATGMIAGQYTSKMCHLLALIPDVNGREKSNRLLPPGRRYRSGSTNHGVAKSTM
jgi:hypothetical protein